MTSLHNVLWNRRLSGGNQSRVGQTERRAAGQVTPRGDTNTTTQQQSGIAEANELQRGYCRRRERADGSRDG